MTDPSPPTIESSDLAVTSDLPVGPQAAALARQIILAAVRSWGLADDDAYDALLVASELVGNGVRHASEAVLHLELALTSLGLLVAVRDGSAVVPLPRRVGLLAESGRGFQIISAVALAWGVEEREGGKRVWAVLPDPRPPRARALPAGEVSA